MDPVGYYEMLALEDACDFVVTDSGGQTDAYFFENPCMTLRDSTEWQESFGVDETLSLARIRPRSTEPSI